MSLWNGRTDDASLRTAWQELAAQAAQQAAQDRPWLLKLLANQGPSLAARYALWKGRIARLRQGERRRLQRRLGIGLGGAALLLALAAAPAPVFANSITVDETTCTLVDAINAANTDSAVGGCSAGSGPDTIDLQADVFLTSYDNSTYGFTGLPVVTSEITIEGNGHTISRDDTATTQIFRILAVFGGDLTLNSATVSGGLAVFGSGIYVSSASLVVSNSTLSGNSALGAGAGIYAGSAAAVEVSNSTLSGNTADTEGGAIYLYSASLALSNSVLYNNGAAGYGGGVKVGGYATVTVANSTIAYNAASYGGGLFAYNAVVDMLNSTLVGNSAGAAGGGIEARSATMTVANSTLSGNTADGRGGGIQAYSASLALLNSTLSGNSADYGGGIFAANSASLSISRSLVSGNTATYSGNEVQNFASTITAANYNLFGHDGEGNAQAFYNFASSGSDIDATSDGDSIALATILNTTLADNDSTVLAGAPAGSVVQTLALPAGSPAIDAAPSADCVAAPFDLDQRAKPRNADGLGNGSFGAECDIGAFELQATTGPVPRIVIQKQTRPDGDATPFQFKLNGPVNRSFTLTDNGVKSTGQIPAGVYSLEEILPPGWTPAIPLDQLTCDDGSPISAIDLGASEVVVCRFLNYKGGNLIVKKVAIPTVASPSFSMRLINNTTSAKQTFSLAHNQQFDSGALDTAATYKLLETVPGGWKKKNIICDNGSPSTAIAVPPGGTVTCTVTNQNTAPSNILLSSTSVAENQPIGTLVGNLSAADSVAGDTHTFSFVNDGTPAAAHNGNFQIVGNQLKTAKKFDFEAKSSHNIKLQVTDSAGQTKVKSFVISIVDGPN